MVNLIDFEWFWGFSQLKLASNHAEIPILTPDFVFFYVNLTFYNKIRAFESLTYSLSGVLGLQNAIFSHFWRFLPVFSVREVQKKFSTQFFFFLKFEPKSFQNDLFLFHNLFLQITINFVATLKMSVFPIFQYKLGFCEKVGFRNPGGEWLQSAKLSKSF